MKLIVTQTREHLSGGPDQVHIFNLASPYDVSSCVILKPTIILIFIQVTHGSKRGYSRYIPTIGGIVFKV